MPGGLSTAIIHASSCRIARSNGAVRSGLASGVGGMSTTIVSPACTRREAGTVRPPRRTRPAPINRWMLARERQVSTAASARSRRWPSRRASTRILTDSSGLPRSRGPSPGYFGSIRPFAAKGGPALLRVGLLDRRVRGQRIEVRGVRVAPIVRLVRLGAALLVGAAHRRTAAALALRHDDVAQALALFAAAPVARLLVVRVLLGETEDAGVVALALEAAQSSFQRLVRTDLDSDHAEGEIARNCGRTCRASALVWCPRAASLS